MIEQPYVYHGSKNYGLSLLNPKEFSKGRLILSASLDPVLALLYASRTGGSFTCTVGREKSTGMVYICERAQNAFFERYRHSIAAVYTLPSERFSMDPEREERAFTEEETFVVKKEVFQDLREEISKLNRQGKLKLVRYPHKINGIPEDDSDLVLSAVNFAWYRGFDAAYEKIMAFQPRLLTRVRSELAKRVLDFVPSPTDHTSSGVSSNSLQLHHS
jgi:hypothetical protein